MSEMGKVTIDREAAYDEYVAPLMDEIIEVCREHGIPLAARFQLTDGDDPLYCTTVIPQEWMSEDQKRVGGSMRSPAFFAYTVRTEESP